jgi:haloacetate dehalogenase
MPMRVLWGEHGPVNQCFQPLEDWKKVAKNVSGKAVSCGHYFPKELPEKVIKEAITFFNADRTDKKPKKSN